jgi:hypothetical protein
MPKVTIKFADENSIPAELKAFKKADSNEVEVWAGDKVAEETNPGLAANRDTILSEKTKLEGNLETARKQWESTNDTLSREVIQLREKVATSSGNTVTADDVAILTAIKPFGGTAEELKTKLESGTAALAENASLKRKIHTQEIGQLLGWKPSVLDDLLSNPEKSKDIEFVAEDVTENDKTVRKVFVNTKNAAGATEKVDVQKFLETNTGWRDYVPALQAEASKTGPTWLKQSKGSDTSATKTDDILEKHINERNQKNAAGVNPLLPNKPAPAPATPTQGA